LEPTANDVMLGRMFLNEERLQLKEDMRLAAEDPGQFSFTFRLCFISHFTRKKYSEWKPPTVLTVRQFSWRISLWEILHSCILISALT